MIFLIRCSKKSIFLTRNSDNWNVAYMWMFVMGNARVANVLLS